MIQTTTKTTQNSYYFKIFFQSLNENLKINMLRYSISLQNLRYLWSGQTGKISFILMAFRVFQFSIVRSLHMRSFSHILLVLNSSINILIYCWKDKNFRNILKATCVNICENRELTSFHETDRRSSFISLRSIRPNTDRRISYISFGLAQTNVSTYV